MPRTTKKPINTQNIRDGLKLVYKEIEYFLDWESITARQTKRCREVTGMGPLEIRRLFFTGKGDIDLAADLIWLATLQADNEANYDELLDNVRNVNVTEMEPLDDSAPAPDQIDNAVNEMGENPNA